MDKVMLNDILRMKESKELVQHKFEENINKYNKTKDELQTVSKDLTDIRERLDETRLGNVRSALTDMIKEKADEIKALASGLDKDGAVGYFFNFNENPCYNSSAGIEAYIMLLYPTQLELYMVEEDLMDRWDFNGYVFNENEPYDDIVEGIIEATEYANDKILEASSIHQQELKDGNLNVSKDFYDYLDGIGGTRTLEMMSISKNISNEKKLRDNKLQPIIVWDYSNPDKEYIKIDCYRETNKEKYQYLESVSSVLKERMGDLLKPFYVDLVRKTLVLNYESSRAEKEIKEMSEEITKKKGIIDNLKDTYEYLEDEPEEDREL